MDLEKKPFLDIKDVLNRLQEELSELSTEATESIKAIAKMRRFGSFSFHKDGSTGVEKLGEKLEKLHDEWNDVQKCLMEFQIRFHNGELAELEDWK